MNFGKLSFLAPAALGLVAFAMPTWATSITGGATIAGNTVTVTPTQVIFGTTFTAAPGNQTGSFVGLTGGTVNAVLTGPPLTGAVSVPDFMTFSGGLAAPIDFDLQQILPGYGTAAACTNNNVGNQCTLAGSPFTLTQVTSGEVAVVLSMSGIAYTGTSSSGSTPISGIFTTQLTMPPNACSTITSCVSLLEAGGSVTASWSASFSTVPEPGSVLLMALGLIGAGSFARFKSGKQ